MDRGAAPARSPLPSCGGRPGNLPSRPFTSFLPQQGTAPIPHRSISLSGRPSARPRDIIPQVEGFGIPPPPWGNLRIHPAPLAVGRRLPYGMFRAPSRRMRRNEQRFALARFSPTERILVDAGIPRAGPGPIGPLPAGPHLGKSRWKRTPRGTQGLAIKPNPCPRHPAGVETNCPAHSGPRPSPPNPCGRLRRAG